MSALTQAPVARETLAETLNHIKTEIAFGDLDGFLTAALCLVRMQEQYGDMDQEDTNDALETLLKYARSALFDANEGHTGVWSVTAGYLFGSTQAAPNTGADTAQPDPPS